MSTYDSQRAGDMAGYRASQPGPRLTPYQARLLARNARRYPEVPAGVHVGAVMLPEDVQRSILEAGNNRAQAAAEPKPKKRKRGGVFGFVDTVVGGAAGAVSDVADFVTPEVVEDAVGFTVGEFSDSFKNIGRPAFAALESPLQAITGAGRQLYGMATGQYAPDDPLDFLHDTAVQTTVGQALADWASGRGVDLGSGFFPAGPTVERRRENERATALIGNSAWTPGRWIATDVLRYEQGSTAYNILSGTIDASIALLGDPANKGLDKWAEAARAARTGSTIVGAEKVARAAAKADSEWRAVVDEAIGLIPSTYKEPRQSVQVSQAAKWLYSDSGRDTVMKLAETASAAEIWRASGKKYPIRLAQQLADTNDPVEVANLLVDALTSDVRQLPRLGLADRVVKNRQEQGRLFNLMPDTRVDWSDPERSFRNVDESLANANVHGDRRRELLDKWARALTGDSRQARFDALVLFEETLQAQLIAHGIPDDAAKEMTRFTGQLHQINRYGLDAFAEGIEFAPGEVGPLMVAQLLNTGYYLYDPRAIRDVRRLTMNNRVLRFISNNPGWRMPTSMVTALQDEIWKPATLMKPAYLAKILPEELGRVTLGGRLSGPLDYMLTMFGRRRGSRVTGEEWTSIAQRADELKAARKELSRLAGQGDARAKEALAELDVEIANLNEEAISKIDDYSAALNRSRPNLLFDDAGYQRMVEQQVRMGNLQNAHYLQNPSEWIEGNADAILMMASDPVAQRVANGGLFDGDSVDAARGGVDGIVDWLNNGAGQGFRDEMAAVHPSLAPEAVAQRMVEVLVDNILYRTGNDPRLLEAIAKGTIDGESIGKFSRVRTSAVSRKLRDVLDDVRLNNPDVARQTLYRPQQVASSGGSRAWEEFTKHRDRLVSWFFQDFYGRASDKMNRSPAFRGFYWDRASELVAHMDPEEAKKLAATAEDVLGKTGAQRIREAAESAAGELTVEDVDKLAGHAALDDTTKLLFDATKRTQLFDAVRILAPFGEAWREILTSYSRLLRQNPRAIRRFQQGVNALRGTGIMHTDETTGQEMITIPLSGELVGIFTGGRLQADMEMGVESLSIGTQVIPGLGPTASFLADKFIPDEPQFDWARRVLFPYGPPEGLNLLPVPPWLSKLGQGVGWVDGQTAKSTKETVIGLLAATGDYGPGERDRLLGDADRVAGALLRARALTQFLAPAAPVVRYTAETPNGNVPAAQVVREFREIGEEEGYDAAVIEMFNRYGPGIAELLVPKTESVAPGLDASPAFGNFERDNPWLFDSHPEIAGFYAPREDRFDYQTYLRQMQAGLRRQLTTNERLAAANQMRGDMIVEARIAQMPPREQWGDVERAYLRELKDTLARELPGFTPYQAVDINATRRQIDELITTASDPRLEDNPVAEAVRLYAKRREEALEAARGQGRAGFSESQDTAVIRAWLRTVGEDLVATHPGFVTVWDRLLSREVDEDE